MSEIREKQNESLIVDERSFEDTFNCFVHAVKVSEVQKEREKNHIFL